jgi:hypothetical protein
MGSQGFRHVRSAAGCLLNQTSKFPEPGGVRACPPGGCAGHLKDVRLRPESAPRPWKHTVTAGVVLLVLVFLVYAFFADFSVLTK